MMKKFLRSGKKHLTALFIAIAVSVPLTGIMPASSTHVSAQAKDQVCQGLGGCPNSESTVMGIIDDVLNILSILIGVAGIIMIMIGGFRYITAGGDASKTASAQNTILWALVGLVVAALSQVIARFVLNTVPNT